MIQSPTEELFASRFTSCSPPPVDDMPSPNFSPSSPNYSVVGGSPDYSVGRGSPVRSTIESPLADVKKEIYASNWKDYVEDIPRLPPRLRSLTPTGFREHDTQEKRDVTATLQKSSWFRIPPNLRRDILLLAFGDRRLHMCLKCDADPPNTWHSFGMVCRHVPTGEKGPMTRGCLDGPWSDECDCPGEHLESIGIMGWLLSCRQNYAETIDILYSKNTILIYDEPLLTRLDQLILPHRLAAITSLEIRWSAELHEHWNTLFDQLEPRCFPNLKRLYISARFDWDHKPHTMSAITGHMNRLVKARPALIECAIAVPSMLFENIAQDYIQMENSWKRSSYSELWYSVDKSDGPHAIRLPYVDSYPRPPFQLGPDPGAGWWLLEGTDAPLSWRWRSNSIGFTGLSVGWENWSENGSP
ncbi:unnamed protein product [Fusarium equiseti]|uniref:DUF7730 domain-containing protein n=1 Tax=Fusarium equiseti TaxID=61235 RepID=A0A8J2J3A2_FUSEQ|nr:unnamed protein product [Fusarium equiseti]